MRERKRLHLRFEGIDVDAHKADMPETEDPFDAECPQCKTTRRWVLMMDITQAGFEQDKIVTIMWCNNCGHYSYLSYIIEHELIDLGD
jgi:C4-type Zn-finger protein